MARKLDWERPRIDAKMREHGTLYVNEDFETSTEKPPKKERLARRKQVQRGSFLSPQQVALGQAYAAAKQQKRLLKEQRLQVSRAAKELKKGKHLARVVATQEEHRREPKGQVPQSGKTAIRIAQRMKNVVVIKVGGGRAPIQTTRQASSHSRNKPTP